MPKELPISEAQAAFGILKNPTTQKYTHKKQRGLLLKSYRMSALHNK